MSSGGALPPHTQDDWRWCNKCQVLTHAGSYNGATVTPHCAAGANHDTSGSGDYVLYPVTDAPTVLRDAFYKAVGPC